MSRATASMLARCSAVIVDQNPSRLLCSRSSATYSTRFLFKSFTSVRYLCPLRKAFSSTPSWGIASAWRRARPRLTARSRIPWISSQLSCNRSNGSILTGVQMSPFPLRLMIVEWAEGAAFCTSPLRFVLVDEVDVHLTLLQFEFYPLHLPRSFDTQDASIEFVILHGCDFLMSGAPSRKGRPKSASGTLPVSPVSFLAEQVQSGPQRSRARRYFRRGAAYP